MKGVSKLEIYGLLGVVKLFINYCRTKFYCRSARLIRFPIEVRGKKYINFGSQLTTGVNCRIEAYPFFKKNTIIKFGHNIEINDYVHIAGINSISIGNNVLIASRVYISDIQHGCFSGNDTHDKPSSIPKERKLNSAPVTIEDNVWIGEGAVVLKGITIGKGSIVGANAVITKDIPENSIVAGIPAKVLKKYNEKTGRWEKQL